MSGKVRGIDHDWRLATLKKEFMFSALGKWKMFLNFLCT